MKKSVLSMTILVTGYFVIAQAGAAPSLPHSVAAASSPMSSVSLPSTSTRTLVPSNHPTVTQQTSSPLTAITLPTNDKTLPNSTVAPLPPLKATHPILKSSGTITLPNRPPLPLDSKSIDPSHSLSSSPGRF